MRLETSNSENTKKHHAGGKKGNWFNQKFGKQMCMTTYLIEINVEHTHTHTHMFL